VHLVGSTIEKLTYVVSRLSGIKLQISMNTLP